MELLPFTRPSIGKQEQQAVSEVLTSGWLATGTKAEALEQALADYVGGGVCVRLFNSATSALEAALLASGVGSGDEVVIPAMSFIATANVVVRVGATPVFVDVDLVSRNLSAQAVEAALTPRTRAVMPVHFAGLAAELQPLYDLAERRGLLVIEDAAQAIGSKVDERMVGAAGNPVCFSFHPNKNMTTIEGGAIASGDRRLVRRLERIRFHGIERDASGNMDVTEWGGKMNLADVNAAIGLVQLSKLDAFNRRRRQLAQTYQHLLPQHPLLVTPRDQPGHSWHMFCVCVDFTALGMTRIEFQRRLRELGVGSSVHYPAMHLFSFYRRYGYGPGDFPVAERIGEQTLTLPLFPAMQEGDVAKVCEAVSSVIMQQEQG